MQTSELLTLPLSHELLEYYRKRLGKVVNEYALQH